MGLVFYHGAPFTFNNGIRTKHTNYIYGTWFSPDGSTLVSVAEGCFLTWDGLYFLFLSLIQGLRFLVTGKRIFFFIIVLHRPGVLYSQGSRIVIVLYI